MHYKNEVPTAELTVLFPDFSASTAADIQLLLPTVSKTSAMILELVGFVAEKVEVLKK